MPQNFLELEPELTPEIISHRAVSGVVVLTVRKFGLKAISYLGSIMLARLLAPEIFGVFAIVSFIITFFAFFSDVGLGAALIQKKESLTPKDLAVTFTLQQILVVAVVLLIYALSPLIAAQYALGEGGVWLIRIFSVSLFLTSLKTIPSILLERRLKFGLLILPEIVEVVAFQVLAVGLAYLGFGVWSFIIGLLVRSFLGTLVLFWVSPWRPRFAWDLKIAKRLVSFGVPFQLNGFIATIKDAVMPVFVGAVSGAAAVGYLNWALTFSKLPILFMSDIFRVTFPTYARIQHDRERLAKAISKTIRFTNLFLFPAVFMLAATAKPIVTLIFTDKWLPALPAFYLHLLGILVVGISNTFMDTFWAMGKTKIAVKLLVIYTVLNWATSVPLVYRYGFIGAMAGSVIVLLVSLPLTWYYMRKLVPLNLFGQLWPAFTAGGLAGLITFGASGMAVNLLSLLTLMFAGGLIYLGLLWLFDRRQLVEDAVWLWSKIKP